MGAWRSYKRYWVHATATAKQLVPVRMMTAMFTVLVLACVCVSHINCVPGVCVLLVAKDFAGSYTFLAMGICAAGVSQCC